MSNSENSHLEGQHSAVIEEISQDSKLLLDAVGGPRGMFESGAPAIIFVSTYALTNHNLQTSVGSAVAVGLVLAVLRLIKRQNLTQVISGFIGIGFSAWLATKSGKAENFFLPGILTNVAYTLLCLGSLIIKRPVLGYVLEAMRGHNDKWRSNNALMQKYRAITVLWTLVFGIRVVIMAPLYFADKTVLLGFFKIALGWPLFALAAYITYGMANREFRK